MSKKIFISYSHDSDGHKAWVTRLAHDLRKLGVEVIYDQDLELGTDLAHFMEVSITQADRVLMICSEQYVAKSNEMRGGAGYEKQIITGELLKNLKTTKFVPLIKQKKIIKTVPVFLSSRAYIDFSNEKSYEEKLQELYKDLSNPDSKSNTVQLKDIQADTSLKLQKYEKQFASVHGPFLKEIIPFSVEFNQKIIAYEKISEEISNISNIAILGPSGCGKSILARKIGLELFEANQIPILIDVKYYENDLLELIEAETSLLSNVSFDALANFCAINSKNLVFILDALNESTSAQRELLARQLRQISSQYSTRIIVTSQQTFSEFSAIKFVNLRVSEPETHLKKNIAQNASSTPLTEKTLELLAVAKTAFESKIIGKLNFKNKSFTSRFSLFDQYARELLEDHARDGVKALAVLGQSINDNLNFSLSINEFERLMDRNNISVETIKKLQIANLISRHEEKVSFGHELLLNAFCSEAVIRICNNNHQSLVEALSLPRHSDYKNMIIGAIEDVSTLELVLSKISDAKIVVDSIRGLCGETSHHWATKGMHQILKKLQEEVSTVQFKIDNKSLNNIASINNPNLNWTPQELAFADALSTVIVSGQFVEDFYSIISIIESSATKAHENLQEEAKVRNIGLKSSLFANCFVGFGSNLVFTKVFSDVQHSFRKSKNEQEVTKWISSKISSALSYGQLMFIIHLAASNSLYHFFSPLLPTLIKERWKYLPYHLKIEILHFVQFLHQLPDDEKKDLIVAIESIDTSNIMISTSVIDALKALGAIENDGYEKTVQAELEKVFSNPENADSWALAQGVYNAQFDHPYDEVYYKVIHELPPENHKLFLRAAIRHKSDFRFFVSTIIKDLIRLEDRDSAQYLVQWTELPPRPNPMPQDALQVFMVAHVAIGIFEYQLAPKEYNESDADNTLNALAEIYYLMNRKDLDSSEIKKFSKSAWNILNKHENGLALSTFFEFSRSYSMLDSTETKHFYENFPEETSEICRKAISNRSIQKENYFRWHNKDENISFGISLLGDLGNKSDISLLKTLVDDPEIGSSAIQAIRVLGEKK